jgi:hypothetical protein
MRIFFDKIWSQRKDSIQISKNTSYPLFIRQGVNLLNKVTQQKTQVYCGYFSYKLYNDNYTGVQQNNLLLADAEFYMNNDLAEPYRPGKI